MTNKDYLYIIAILALVISFTPIATHFIDEATLTSEEYREELAAKQDRIEQLNERIAILKGYIIHDAIATMYEPLSYQTDSTPDILADGTKINRSDKKLHKLRYVALSRDLLKYWGGPYKFNDYIVVEGTGEYDGIWQVKDSMAPQWVRRVDFLVSIGTPHFRYDNVTLKKYAAVKADI